MDGTTQEPSMPNPDPLAPPPNTIGGTNPGDKPVTIVSPTIVNVGAISPPEVVGNGVIDSPTG